MGLWTGWTEWYFQQYGEEWLSKGECIEGPFLKLLDRAVSSIKIAIGETDPSLWNKEEIIEKFDKKMKGLVIVEMIFHEEDDKKAATLDLFSGLVKLKRKHPEYLRLYRQKKSSVHFVVVDASHILFENIYNNPNEQGEVLIKYKTKLLGKKLDEIFNFLKEREAEEIILGELSKKVVC